MQLQVTATRWTPQRTNTDCVLFSGYCYSDSTKKNVVSEIRTCDRKTKCASDSYDNHYAMQYEPN